jgi:hypothetical protein
MVFLCVLVIFLRPAVILFRPPGSFHLGFLPLFKDILSSRAEGEKSRNISENEDFE